MRTIRRTLLRKLYYQNKWGNSHTSVDNLPKGFPPEIKGKVKKVAKELIHQGLLISKPTAYGVQVSLNTKRKKEIENIAFG